MTSPDEATLLLPLVEAASRLGCSVDALRSRIRRRQVTARRGNDGRLLVEVAAEARPSHDSPVTAPDAELVAEIGDLREALARAEAQRDAAESVAEAQVAALRELCNRLTSELADARRPWLARVLAAIRRPG